ncbi:MAG TPA: glycosyltransferase family 9 protein [Candidatus Cloacimonadota bacterium]|jgi:ADP-heptose:LPS heptosyltransferase|nr:glycosyltransferase family 9 protein [Candidatus Cloacimonadales bacterium]HPY96314.1 glycosyltransferase family 9 protein [Candidatus Cloacimonadota bacterium]HQB40987.1 glycosyltransferase family 9 protein [Candidatus Cloacimonadota bacterium]
MSNKKILISHTFGIGDIIMAIPMLKYLRHTYPGYQIDLFTTNKAVASLMQTQAYFNNIYSSARSPKELLATIVFLRKRKYDYYIVTAASNASKPIKHGLISWLIHAKQRFGEYVNKPMPLYTKNQKFSQETHKVQSNINLAKLISEQAMPDDLIFYPELTIDKKTETFGQEWYQIRELDPKKTLIFHIGSSSGGKHRRWSQENFTKLILRLRQDGWQTVVVSGEDEFEESQIVAQATSSSLLCRQTLLEVFSVLKRAHAFINADSGLSHLASAASIKIFSLFGPGDERKTGPYAKESYIIRNTSSSCQRCLYPSKHCTMECMRGLGVDYVYQQIKSRLQEKSK